MFPLSSSWRNLSSALLGVRSVDASTKRFSTGLSLTSGSSARPHAACRRGPDVCPLLSPDYSGRPPRGLSAWSPCFQAVLHGNMRSTRASRVGTEARGMAR